jgi:uncharacterized protein (DUF1800 family)
MDIQQQNKLLYARAGFGISLQDYANALPVEKAVGQLFPSVAPGDLEMVTDAEWLENNPKAMKAIGDEMERKEKQKAFRERSKDINLLWIEAMVDTSFPLLEKTALFWHGHFATKLDNPYFDQKLLNTFRKNALGNFGDLLREISKSPAMLQFLNNRQNKKEHPNENFAREVMELFTLGRGHYTEDDVKEAARAFTGWNFDEYGNFIFRRKQHDDGAKKFLGKTGNFDGDDILNILLEQKQVAIFITQKIYRYFVSDEKIDDRRVKELANHFYKSNYDITSLLKKIFTASWFYTGETAGAKIKSPIELLIGYQRTLPISYNNPNTIINLQRVLGQYLFNPPNVAGWPGGKYWIDSSSLVIRMRLPEALFMSKELDLSAKETDPDMAGKHKTMAAMDAGLPAKQFRVGRADVDWTSYIAFWKKYKKEEWPSAIAAYLLPTEVQQEQLQLLSTFADRDSDDEYIKSLTILLMELPEYQLT